MTPCCTARPSRWVRWRRLPDGQVDRIILTGGIAHSKYVADYLTKKLSFIAPVEVMAGEFEMEALAARCLPGAGGGGEAPRFLRVSVICVFCGNFLGESSV